MTCQQRGDPIDQAGQQLVLGLDPLVRGSLSFEASTQATTVFLWTSKLQHRGSTTSTETTRQNAVRWDGCWASTDIPLSLAACAAGFLLGLVSASRLQARSSPAGTG